MKNYLLSIIAAASLITGSYGAVLFDQTTHIELPLEVYSLPVPLDFWVSSTSRLLRPGQGQLHDGVLFRYDDPNDPLFQLISDVFEGPGWRFASLVTPGYEVLLMDRVPLGEIASSFSLIEVAISDYSSQLSAAGLRDTRFNARLRIEGERASVPESGNTGSLLLASFLLLVPSVWSRRALV